SSADHFTYNDVPVPTVSALSVAAATSAGGVAVTLTGTGFSNASVVSFGGTGVYDFTVNSDTSLTVVAPPGYAGTVDVTVISATGTSARSSAARFPYVAAAAPTVSSLGSSSGSTAGGTMVT